MGTEVAELAEACLTYLGQEEQALRSTLETLRVVRAAALAGDVSGLEALHGRQEADARKTTVLCDERSALRERIATVLHVSANDATLALLAGHVGGATGERLLSAGARLRQLVSEIDRVNCSNTATIKYCLSFTRRVLRDLTGVGTPAESYGPDGTPTESPCGPLLSARG